MQERNYKRLAAQSRVPWPYSIPHRIVSRSIAGSINTTIVTNRLRTMTHAAGDNLYPTIAPGERRRIYAGFQEASTRVSLRCTAWKD